MKLGRIMFVLLQLIILLVINKVGFIVVDVIHLPIPGNVMGMLLLFILLSIGAIRLTWVEEVSTFLIKHLSFFFIPVSVGLMTLAPLFLKNGLALLVVLIISTLVGILVSGSLSQVLVKRKEAIRSEQHHHHL